MNLFHGDCHAICGSTPKKGHIMSRPRISFEFFPPQTLDASFRLWETVNTLAPLDPDALYVLTPESGLRVAHGDDAHPLSGEQWLGLQAAMDGPAPFITTLRACAGALQALRPQLRHLLHYHCGVRVFKTRQLMLDVQAMTRPRSTEAPALGETATPNPEPTP